MFKLILVVIFAVCIGLVGGVSAQDATQKTKELVAALDKTKYKKKDKGVVHLEFFVDVKNEAALRSDRSQYTGAYEADGYLLTLTVLADGSVKGSGYDSLMDSDKPVNFELKNARLDGALITGTKVFDNGTEQPFEAVFVNRTTKSGSNPKTVNAEETQFGVGFIQNGGAANSAWSNRVFLARR